MATQTAAAGSERAFRAAGEATTEPAVTFSARAKAVPHLTKVRRNRVVVPVSAKERLSKT